MKDLLFFIHLFKPHWIWLLAGVLLSIFAAFAGIGLLTLAGWFISAAAIAGVLAPDGVAITFNFMQPAAEIRALAIIRTLGRYAERVVTHDATFRILARVRVWFFQRLIPLSPAQLEGIRAGDLLSRVTADIEALDALYLRLLVPLLVSMAGITAAVLLMTHFAPVIGLTALPMLLLAIILIPLLIKRWTEIPARETVLIAARLRVQIIDMLQGLAELLSFQAFDRFQQAALALSEQQINYQRKTNRLAAISSALHSLVSQLAVLAVLAFGVSLISQQRLSGPELALLVFCVIALFELVMPLPQALQMLGKTREAAGRIREIAEMPALIPDPPRSMAMPQANGLSLEQVSFRYPEQQHWLLDTISLEIPQAGKIAILGRSGSGKTSLLQLLLRYHDPLTGRVKLGGSDIRCLKSDDLLERFGVVSQQPRLFSATVRDNILLGNPQASAEQLADAIDAARLTDFIGQLPDGLQTWVGENGLTISGGEVSRIALARVYLKNAPILLLDEPTEGLDAETEADVFAALKEMSENRTVVMVTHRSAGLDLVDHVYWLESGILIAQ